MSGRDEHELLFDSETGTFYLEHGWTNTRFDSMATRIPILVGIVTDRNPSSLPALYDRIDPDALDELLAATADVTVTFTYADCELTVSSDGDLEIRPVDLRGGRRSIQLPE